MDNYLTRTRLQATTVGFSAIELKNLLNSLTSPGPAIAARLKAVVLLAGSVRATPLVSATQRSLLDLPVTESMTLLNVWGIHFAGILNQAPNVKLRVLFDRRTPIPAGQLPDIADRFTIERDPLPFRGTGGLLSDVVKGYSRDDLVLVADAAQVLTTPLNEFWQAMASKNADIVMSADSAGRAAGVTLIRSEVLRDVQSVGFADFKEQVLPQLKNAGARIQVLQLPIAPSLVVREIADYLNVVRAFHTNEPTARERDGETWEPRFSLIESGAQTAADAKVFDSVVLRDAVIKPGARVIRSIVAAGAVVNEGERVADQLVTVNGRQKIET